MIKIFRPVILFLTIMLLSHCGYTPLLSSVDENFYIENLNFSGNKKVNNSINRSLEKHKEYKENLTKYNLDISSRFDKNIVTKDRSGNAKNYEIILTVDISYQKDDASELNKIFRRNASLASQSQKSKEIDLEKKIRNNLSQLISRDIIFFLTNQ